MHMRKIIMALAIFLMSYSVLRSETKIGTDGYTGGLTLTFESGLSFAGYNQKKPYPVNRLTTIVDWIDQRVNISNPFINVGALLPREGITYFANFSTFWNKETRNWSYPNLQENLSYLRFSISVGFKLYFK